MKQTLVIGSAVVDVILNTEQLPKRGQDVQVSRQKCSLGGCAYLVSDMLRHFGMPYSLCTAVGGGMFGEFVLHELTKKGVPVYVKRPEKENGCCYCLVEPDGERSFLVDHGVEYTFHESYLEKINTETIDSVYICGLEIEEETGQEIIDYLKKHREYTVYFATGPRIMQLWEKFPERVRELFSLHPVLHLNEEESISFTGKPTAEEAARALYAQTGNTVIVTLGEKGSLCCEKTGISYAAPVPAEVKDTIGAGDGHMGAVIAARRQGLSFPEAIRLANRISAKIVETEGGGLGEEVFRQAVAEFRE